MKNIIKNRNTIIVSISLTATLFIYSFLNGSSLAPALLFGGVSLVLLIIQSTPRTVYSVGIVALEALLLGFMVQEVVLPIAQGYDEKGGIDLYLVYGIVLQIVGFVLFPLISLLMYRLVNGRTWLNLLVLFFIFNAGLFIAMTDMGNVALITLTPISALLIGIAFVVAKHFLIKRKTTVKNEVALDNPEPVAKILNANNIEPLKENKTLFFSRGKKDYKVTLINGNMQVGSNGIFLNNKEITDGLNDEFRSSRKINIVVNDSIKKDLVSKVKAYNLNKPDAESNSVYIMNLETFSEFINK